VDRKRNPYATFVVLAFAGWLMFGGDVGGCNLNPLAPAKVDRVTYVHNEKDVLPSGVMAALNELNAKGILATSFPDDTTDGNGEVPGPVQDRPAGSQGERDSLAGGAGRRQGAADRESTEDKGSSFGGSAVIDSFLVQRSLHRPSPGKSPVDARRLHATVFNPIGHTLRLSTDSDQPASSLVSSLITVCSPNAVARLVVAVVVLALNCVASDGDWAHIRNEVFKYQPAIANSNPPSAVTFKSLVAGLETPPLHCRPPGILWGFCHPMSYKNFAMGFCYQAAARSRMSSTQRVSSSNGRGAATAKRWVAQALPHHLFVPVLSGDPNSPQASKLLIADVFESSTARVSLALSHDVRLSMQGDVWLEPADVSASVPARFIIAIEKGWLS
jgi:hypothetical protein